jgi:hypothetical protein
MSSTEQASFQGTLTTHLARQSGQLEKAVADAIAENATLQAKLGTQQHSLIELDATLTLFADFATMYHRLVLGLVSPQDHKRLATALSKIQLEIFVLRRLVEQRSSDNLRPMLQIADHWCNTYLLSLIYPNKSAAVPGGLFRSKVLGDDYGKALTATELIAAPGAAPAFTFSEPKYRNWCLVFFESEHLIRLGRFAYNRNPTVSLPLVHAYEPWNWLGMAHEIGHFVFHNTDYLVDHMAHRGLTASAGETNGDSKQPAPPSLAMHVRKTILTGLANHYLRASDEACDYLGIAHSIPLWCTWSEELFADLLGAVTLGPAYVESLATHIAASVGSEDDLLRDDSVHPVACLRPILQILVHLLLLERETGKRGNASLSETGMEQLKNELGRIAKLWFEFCENHFEKWTGSVPVEVSKLILSSPSGICGRLLWWRTLVSRFVGYTPFAIVLEQVNTIATAFADEILNGVPLYDDVAFQRTRTLAYQAAAVATELEADAETASPNHSDIDATVESRDFLHFLAAEWYQPAKIDLSDQSMREQWLAATRERALKQDLGSETVDSEVDWRNQTQMVQPQLAVEALVKQLIHQDSKPEEWQEKILDAWATSKAPNDETLEIADWLLGISFATHAPLDGCPKPGQTRNLGGCCIP